MPTPADDQQLLIPEADGFGRAWFTRSLQRLDLAIRTCDHAWMPFVPIRTIIVRSGHPIRVPVSYLKEMQRRVKGGVYEPLLVTRDFVLVDGMIRYQALLANDPNQEVEVAVLADSYALAKHVANLFNATPTSKLNLYWRLLHAQTEYHREHPETTSPNEPGHVPRESVVPTYRASIHDATATQWPAFADLVQAQGGPPARTINRYLLVAKDIVPEVFQKCDRSKGCSDLGILRQLSELNREQQLRVVDEVESGRCDLASAVVRETKASFAATPLPSEPDAPYRLEYGDYLQIATILADNTVDLVLTDPPWQSQTREQFGPTADVISRKLKAGGIALIVLGHRWVPDMLDAVRLAGLEYKWISIYEHPEPIPSAHPEVIREAHNCYPVIVAAKPGEPRPVQTDWFRELSGSVPSPRHHQYWKSVECLERMIVAYTQPDDLVYDLFFGGGATAIAAFRTARRFFGSDANKANVQNAIAWLTDTRMANHCYWGADLADDGSLRYDQPPCLPDTNDFDDVVKSM